MKKTAMFVFNGSPLCFVHVLLNALDMQDRGDTVAIVMEGEATRLVGELEKPDNWLNGLWRQARDQNLVAGACQACSQKLDVRESVEASGLPLLADMKGHPGMAAYRDKGFEIITF
jgi:hypothetical protein